MAPFGSLSEGLVEKRDGKLVYSLTVESGFASCGFSFEIEARDRDILIADPYRRAVLYNVLHTLLQNTFGSTGQPPSKFTQQQFRKVTSVVLFSPDSDLKQYVQKFSADHNIALEIYVAKQLARKK